MWEDIGLPGFLLLWWTICFAGMLGLQFAWPDVSLWLLVGLCW